MGIPTPKRCSCFFIIIMVVTIVIVIIAIIIMGGRGSSWVPGDPRALTGSPEERWRGRKAVKRIPREKHHHHP